MMTFPEPSLLFRLLRLAAAFMVLAVAPCALASADSDWKAIVAMDAGPKLKPSSREEAFLIARNHFLSQKKALSAFLKKYPADPRAPEVRARYAEIVATEGKMDGDPSKVAEGLRVLSDVAATESAPAKVRADAAFQAASIRMQNAPGGPEKGHKSVVAAAESFQRAFPDDIRGARLLVEAATVCDAVPDVKRGLLTRADGLTSEPALKRRIADDLRRLDLLGKPLEIAMPDLNGGTLDLAALRGQPLVLVFWSSDAPQSLLWLRDFRADWEKNKGVRVATISLDKEKPAAKQRASAFRAPWPVGFEAGGWNAPTARKLGINALQSVWILDRQGVVRSLNAKSNWREWIAKLSAE